MRRVSFWVATFGGVGLTPFAPGTFGSLASLLIWGPLAYYNVSWLLRLAIVAAIFAIGLWSCTFSSMYFSEEDPQAIVIDEVAGQGLALIFCPPSVLLVVLGFIYFRIFDIKKPWPVSWADKSLGGPMGIMLDDIFAGLYALIFLTVTAQFI